MTRLRSRDLLIFVCRFDRVVDEVTIALVGKYTRLEDSYISVIKALKHAALSVNRKLHLNVCLWTIEFS